MGETDWGENLSCSDGQVHAQKIFNPILLIGGAVFPPCCLTWGQTVVGVMKKMVSSIKRLDKIQGQVEFGKCLPYIKFKFYQRKKESEVSQLCLTLCDPMDCSLPGSSVHGIFQARILERVAISFSNSLSICLNDCPSLISA